VSAWGKQEKARHHGSYVEEIVPVRVGGCFDGSEAITLEKDAYNRHRKDIKMNGVVTRHLEVVVFFIAPKNDGFGPRRLLFLLQFFTDALAIRGVDARIVAEDRDVPARKLNGFELLLQSQEGRLEGTRI